MHNVFIVKKIYLGAKIMGQMLIWHLIWKFQKVNTYALRFALYFVIDIYVSA